MLPIQTHTYVTLEVSQSTYDEIASKLKEAGYEHCFMINKTPAHGPPVFDPSSDLNVILIDMHGIALKTNKEM